jgi:hypothetical protein
MLSSFTDSMADYTKGKFFSGLSDVCRYCHDPTDKSRSLAITANIQLAEQELGKGNIL